MQTLDDNQRMKIAFLLHQNYGLHDVAYWVLSENSPVLAEQYWHELRGNTPDSTRARDQSCHTASMIDSGDESISRELDNLLS